MQAELAAKVEAANTRAHFKGAILYYHCGSHKCTLHTNTASFKRAMFRRSSNNLYIQITKLFIIHFTIAAGLVMQYQSLVTHQAVYSC